MSTEVERAPHHIPRSTPASTGARSLGIERAHYVAVRSPEPAAAAAFAVEHMGFALVHADADGRHYLAAHGRDPYSLIYTPGENGLDHVSYVVRDLATLGHAEQTLGSSGVRYERVEKSELWRHEPALRFRSPGGHLIELSPGINVHTPMAAAVSRPRSAPAPIACDHVVPRVVDIDAEIAFALGPMGLRESSRIEAPDVGAVLAFFRAHTIYHCYAAARAPYNGIHHYQFTLKDGPAVLEAYESMRNGGRVELIWGPVRHGPGHNIAFYFRDGAGNFVEYSAEEEVILENDTYAPQRFSVIDHRSMDEWGSRPPEIFF